MAYTKSPVQDSHGVTRLSSIHAPIVVTDDSQIQPISAGYVDCFPYAEKQVGDEPKVRVHKRIPVVGTVMTGTTVTTGSLGGSIVSATQVNRAFGAKGGRVYMFNYEANTVTLVHTATSPEYGNGTNCIDSSLNRLIAFLEAPHAATALLICDESGGSTSSTNLSARDVDGTKGLVFLNGYLFAVKTDGFKIFNSTAGGVLTTWASTDFIDAELYGDPTLFIDRHKNALVAFGANSIEFFVDGAVEVGSPLVRQESYASRVGIRYSNEYFSRRTAKIGDDIYFMGCSDSRSLGLFRIRDFRVEEIPNNQYFRNLVNFVYTDAQVPNEGYGVETLIINQRSMIHIPITASFGIVYDPETNHWWKLTLTTADMPSAQDRIGGMFFTPTSAGAYADARTIKVAALTGVVTQYRPDYTSAVSLDAYIYSDVVDLGTNRYKHLARVDALGDYGQNTLTLAINPTPNFGQTYTALSARVPSTDGYSANTSWYNLGAARRFSTRLTISGAGPAYHDGYEVEYTVGMT